METQAALDFIRQTLKLEAVIYFEVQLDSPCAVAEVALALRDDECNVTAYPLQGLVKISRKLHNPGTWSDRERQSREI
jgi:hypothetical protein